MKLDELRSKYRDDILRTAKECGILSVKVFGSTARNEATDKSDVDFLISAKKSADLLSIGQFQIEMEELLKTKVDVVFEGCIHRRIVDQVMEDAVLL